MTTLSTHYMTTEISQLSPHGMGLVQNVPVDIDENQSLADILDPQHMNRDVWCFSHQRGEWLSDHEIHDMPFSVNFHGLAVTFLPKRYVRFPRVILEAGQPMQYVQGHEHRVQCTINQQEAQFLLDEFLASGTETVVNWLDTFGAGSELG